MAEQHALGLAGRAGGVDEAGQVVAVHVHHVGRALLALLLHVGIGQAPLVALAVEDDEVAEVGQLGTEGGDPVADCLIGHDRDLGAAVAQDVLPVLVELRLVHRHEGRAETVGRVGRDRPLGAVVGDDGDAVALVDPEGAEPTPHAIDLGAELAVGHPLPSAAVLGAEEGPFTEAPHAALVNVVQAGEPGLEARCRHGS